MVYVSLTVVVAKELASRRMADYGSIVAAAGQVLQRAKTAFATRKRLPGLCCVSRRISLPPEGAT
jgi:hypothetical protein